MSPINYWEVINDSNQYTAIKTKTRSIQKNHTWKVIDKELGMTLIIAKWLFKLN